MEHKYEFGSAEWQIDNKITKCADGNFVKKCGYSKTMKPIGAFSIHPSGKFEGLYCSVSDANKAVNAESKVKHNKTDKRKISQKNSKQSAVGKARQKRNRESAVGKATIKRSNESAAGKARQKRNKESAVGRATIKRNHESAAGKARREREYAARRLRTIEDRGWAMDMTVLSASYKLISGRYETSPKFLKRTGWGGFRKHMRQLVEAKGFDWKNHGNAPGQWNLEHRIPRSEYDFLDPEEIKRCWSAANLDVKSFEENEAKADAILPSEVKLVPECFWPKAWNGVMPDQSERLKIWEMARERKAVEVTRGIYGLDEFEEESNEQYTSSDEEDSDPNDVSSGEAGPSTAAAESSSDSDSD